MNCSRIDSLIKKMHDPYMTHAMSPYFIGSRPDRQYEINETGGGGVLKRAIQLNLQTSWTQNLLAADSIDLHLELPCQKGMTGQNSRQKQPNPLVSLVLTEIHRR